ncbi:MAG: DUF6483 family protein [Ignavibacteria bacterium]
MLQRDYLMKMVEMLTAVMAKVIFNKEQKKYDEALTEIENAGKNIVGLDIGMVKILKIDDFTGLMKTSDVFAGRCLISAELLLEYAKILEEKETDTDLKFDFYNKSFRLYTEALLTKEILEPDEYIKKAESILPVLKSSGYFNNQSDYYSNNLTLFEFYNLSGNYSKAEDILFNMLESKSDQSPDYEENKRKLRKRAVVFYNDLMELEEEKLLTGNFSKDEAEDGLQEIKDMMKLN